MSISVDQDSGLHGAAVVGIAHPTQLQPMEFDEHGNLYPVHGQAEPAMLELAVDEA